MKNRLYRGDCKTIADELIKQDVKVDLIYLDPPFNSNRTYSMLFNHRGMAAQQKAYHDMWDFTDSTRQLILDFKDELKTWELPDSFKQFMNAWLGILEQGTSDDRKLLNYLMYMTQRLIRLKKLLTPTGSIYFHCDSNASHYLKVIMDGIFKRDNFRREIVWSNEDSSGFKSQARNWIRDMIPSCTTWGGTLFSTRNTCHWIRQPLGDTTRLMPRGNGTRFTKTRMAPKDALT